MDDDLQDSLFYQTYLAHMKLISRLAVGLPINSTPIGHIWRLLRIYILKPEVLICGAVLFIILVYLQAVDVWASTLLNKLKYTVGRSTSKVTRLQYFVNGSVTSGENLSWELKEDGIAAYAIQGRRPKMEDRFVVNEDIDKTGVSLFAVFDGHGGEFAANYARDKLMKNLNNKVIEINKLVSSGHTKLSAAADQDAEKKPEVEKKIGSSSEVEKKSSFRKTMSTSQTDESMNKSGGVTDPELLSRLDILQRPVTRVPMKTTTPVLPAASPISYINENGKIDYGRLLTDEVLAADHLLVQAAKKNYDVAGTTALIAVIDNKTNRLIIANVGDSRGVMYSKGKTVPLSFDHKPQQMRERKRIVAAGGSVTFNGVWRVNGILATSRALGDYPLKDKKYVIADPDILTFDLTDHMPTFLLLASDGLWDSFSNEEAVAFIKERLNEPHYGAKSITLQAYYRGSMDNITVVVINFKDKKWSSFTMKKPA